MFWLILAGLLAGMLGGMGMGGGTVYIPILTEVFRFPQHMAQWLNLVAFVPMAAVSLIIHAKNKLLDKKAFVSVIIPSAISAVFFAVVAVKMPTKVLSAIFAVFLTAMGLFGLGTTLCALRKEHRRNTPKEPPNE